MDLITPGKPIDLTCKMLIVCGLITIDATDVKITASQIYLDGYAAFKMAVPAKAAKGADGAKAGEDGANGKDGATGFSMTLTAFKMMTSSSKRIVFISRGGDGGDGGDGVAGSDNADKIPERPDDAKDVERLGKQASVI